MSAMTIRKSPGTNRIRWSIWKPLRFVELFLFIVLFLLISPLLSRSPLLSALIAAFFLNILIVTLSSVGFKIGLRWFLLALWLLAILLNGAVVYWTRNAYADQLLAIASHLVGAILVFSCVVFILRHVLTSHEVTVDTIFAAFVAYFLIAFAFSLVYQAVAVFEPGSFSLPAAANGRDGTLQIQLNYFSFVTLATLGYGDIVPRLPLAQTLAILEAVTGLFYLAVVIAWLVSSFARQGKDGQIAPARRSE